MEMDQRQRRTVTVLLSILAVLVAAVLIVLGSRYREARREAEAEQQAQIEAAQPGADKSALTYHNGSATLSFAKNEAGAWIWTDEPDFPLDPATVNAIMGLLADLHPQQTLTPEDGPEAYGLDTPTATLTATMADGTSTTLTLGKTTTDGESYYMVRDGDDSVVYIIAGTLYKMLCVPVYDMCVLPEVPAFPEEDLARLVVQGAAPPAPEGQEAAPAPEVVLTARQAGAGKAVEWSGGGGSVTGSASLTDLLSDLAAMTILKCVDYRPSDRASSICGFDAPLATLTVERRGEEEAPWTMTVGAAALGDAGRYVRLGEDTSIYLVAEDRVDALMQIAAAGAVQ